MGTTKTRVAAMSLAAMLLLFAITPAFAESGTSNEAGVESSVTVDASGMSTAAYLIPVEREQSEINGEMVITEVFEVPSYIDPNSLIKGNFELGGYLYSENSIVKTPHEETKEKDVEIQYEQAVSSSDLSAHLGELPASIAYDKEEGWEGTLYLNPQTVNIATTKTSTKNSTSTQTKTYNVEMNDPTLVPETYEGMKRTSLQFTPSGFIEGSSIPSGYTATATYSKTTSKQVASAWSMSATYSGTVEFVDTGSLRYTVVYKGISVPEKAHVEDGQIVPNEGYEWKDGQLVQIKPEKMSIMSFGVLSTLMGIGAVILLIALIDGLILLVLWAIRKGHIYSHKVVIQAQDDVSGEYSVIQKTRINVKSPNFTIDTLKAPSSRHFLCKMSGPMANKLRSKIVNVSADGAVVTKHRVEPLNEKEPYIFSVDLEVVEAGPMDTFAL